MLKHFTNCKIIHQVAAQVQNSIKLHNVQALAKGSYTTRSFGLKSRQLITQNGMIGVWKEQSNTQNYPRCTVSPCLYFVEQSPKAKKLCCKLKTISIFLNLGSLYQTWGDNCASSTVGRIAIYRRYWHRYHIGALDISFTIYWYVSVTGEISVISGYVTILFQTL